jgi:hypothetical protein
VIDKDTIDLYNEKIHNDVINEKTSIKPAINTRTKIVSKNTPKRVNSMTGNPTPTVRAPYYDGPDDGDDLDDFELFPSEYDGN